MANTTSKRCRSSVPPLRIFAGSTMLGARGTKGASAFGAGARGFGAILTTEPCAIKTRQASQCNNSQGRQCVARRSLKPERVATTGEHVDGRPVGAARSTLEQAQQRISRCSSWPGQRERGGSIKGCTVSQEWIPTSVRRITNQVARSGLVLSLEPMNIESHVHEKWW